MNQSKNILLKTLALTMVLFILVIPALPSQQYKKVKAAEGIVDPQFYAAILTMIGITSVAIGTMSPNFSIPQADFTALKDQFALSLEADATKKAAWMTAQTEYLAGGIAKTMGATELAKIGVNDIYVQFKNYVNDIFKYQSNVVNKPSKLLDSRTKYVSSYMNYEIYTYDSYGIDIVNIALNKGYNYQQTAANRYTYGNVTSPTTGGDVYIYDPILNKLLCSGQPVLSAILCFPGSDYSHPPSSLTGVIWAVNNDSSYYSTEYERRITMDIVNNFYINKIGKIFTWNSYLPVTSVKGSVIYNPSGDILNTTDIIRSIIPTIPWIDTSIPIGTIVTPAISAPYAGAVPIDVPITIPIDPTDPVDPPVEEDNTLIGTVAAILAGILPISGILDDIKIGIDGIATTITTTITDITSPLTIVSDAVLELEVAETEYIDEWGEYRPIEELKQKFDLKLPIIAALITGIGVMFGSDDDTRPLIIVYPWDGETKYITLDWYEPMRLQVREALALCFKLMTALSIYALLSSIFGLGVIQKSSSQMLKFESGNDRK